MTDSGCIRLMIVGVAGSGAGKSTTCLCILGSLVESGLYKPEDLAYIKPCTQGIQQTLVAKWCKSHNITCRHVGPVVFFNGFTKKFLAGELDPEYFIDPTISSGAASVNSSASIISKRKLYTLTLEKRVLESVDQISAGKKLVLIDGVGYPSVGSICGICNATVAKLCKAAVIVLGKPGLGDSIDSWNMTRAYMETKISTRQLLGMIINRVRPGEMKKTENVKMYFREDSTQSKNNSTFPSEEYVNDIVTRKLYGIIQERESLFESTEGTKDADYAPPGEHNQCNITFRPPKPSQLQIDPLSDREIEICKGLIQGFSTDITPEIIKQLLDDCESLSKLDLP